MPDAYRLETYWSGKAHQLGIDGVPVKYIARPCNSNGIYVPTKAVDFAERTSDFLQVELKRHIEQPLDLEPRKAALTGVSAGDLGPPALRPPA